MTHQTELGLNLAIARGAIERMQRKAASSLEHATQDITALEAMELALDRVVKAAAYDTRDAAALGACQALCAHVLETARFRQSMLRHRDTLETRVERYLGE